MQSKLRKHRAGQQLILQLAAKALGRDVSKLPPILTHRFPVTPDPSSPSNASAGPVRVLCNSHAMPEPVFLSLCRHYSWN